jgi:hypothetical protein
MNEDWDAPVAAAVRAACLRAAQDAYEQAASDGLCHEGAWEAALDAIRSLDLASVRHERATGLRTDRSRASVD